MAKSNRKTGGPAVVDLEAQEELEGLSGEQTQQLLDQEWILSARDTRTPFFDVLQDIPEGGWDKCTIYLYRLDPAVSNKQGDKKYIAVYGTPITEEGIKQEHGGGKYHAYLKYGKETLRNHRFSIEGQPIFIEGQTARGTTSGVPALVTPSGGPQAPSDLVSVVRQVIEATKGDKTAENAGIEVLKSAMQSGLALNKSIVESQIGSTTGNKVGDKVLEMLLPRLLDQKQPELPPIVTKMLEAAMGLLKNPREPVPEPAADPLKQFTFVKELLGVDSIRELFDRQGRVAEQPFWVPILTNAMEKLPSVLQSYGEMQERAFQRALIAHQIRGGTPGALPAGLGMIPPSPAAVPPMAAVAPAPTSATAEQQAQQMVSTIVDAICRAWDEGYPGDVAGAHLKIGYPLWVEQLKPLLADPAQLSAFIASIPALAERAAEAEWPEFQADLIAELNQVPLPIGAEPAGGVVAGAAAEPAPPPPAPAGVTRTKKKPTNGRAA